MSAKTPSPYAVDPLVKQPTEEWPFVMPFGRLLGDQSIAAVTDVRFFKGTWPSAPKTTSVADPENPAAGDLRLVSSGSDGELVSLVLAGGQHGQDYYIEIDVETASGRVRSADGWLLVRDHRVAE